MGRRRPDGAGALESGKRGFAASFVNAGAPTGAVLGTFIMGAFSSLPNEQFLAWGWRVPFLLSFVLLGVGMFVRLKVSRAPSSRPRSSRRSANGDGRTGRAWQAQDSQRPVPRSAAKFPPAGAPPAEDADLHHARRCGRVRAAGGAGNVRGDLRRLQGRGPPGCALCLRGSVPDLHRLCCPGRKAFGQAGPAARDGGRTGGVHRLPRTDVPAAVPAASC